MKKLFMFIIFTLMFLLTSCSFAERDFEFIEKTETTEYYGYLSLIIDTHLEIGRGKVDDNSIFFIVSLLNEMKLYTDLDIIKYLGYTFDIKKTFDSLLYDIRDVLDRSEVGLIYIKENLVSFKNKKIECDDLKKNVDKDFSLALKDLDIKNMEFNLNKSLEYEKCSSDSRIYYNAQNKILEELDFYYKILEHKYSYFYSNKFAIVENYPNILYNLKK